MPLVQRSCCSILSSLKQRAHERTGEVELGSVLCGLICFLPASGGLVVLVLKADLPDRTPMSDTGATPEDTGKEGRQRKAPKSKVGRLSAEARRH